MCKFVTLDIVNTKNWDFVKKSQMFEDFIHKTLYHTFPHLWPQRQYWRMMNHIFSICVIGQILFKTQNLPKLRVLSLFYFSNEITL